MLALACDLVGCWPTEALDKPDTEVYLAAQLQARKLEETLGF